MRSKSNISIQPRDSQPELAIESLIKPQVVGRLLDGAYP